MIAEPDFKDLIARYEAAAAQFGKGDAGPVKEFSARQADLTLMSGAGGCFKGWEDVTTHLDWAASHFSGATEWDYELLAWGKSGDLGYAVVLEHERGTTVAGGDTGVSRNLRATLVFRRRGEEWKLIHRHADPMAETMNLADLFREASSTETEQNKALDRRFVEEVLNQGSLEVIDELRTIDLDGTRQRIRMFRSAFPDLHVTIETQVADGDWVVSRCVFRGTHLGDLMGLPPTGKTVEFQTIAMNRYSNGKSVEEWGIRDIHGLLQQLRVL
jgi:predicted ester cyclase/ketosteroid isomerase-like protein